MNGEYISGTNLHHFHKLPLILAGTIVTMRNPSLYIWTEEISPVVQKKLVKQFKKLTLDIWGRTLRKKSKELCILYKLKLEKIKIKN
jgi:hypothetical protein